MDASIIYKSYYGLAIALILFFFLTLDFWIILFVSAFNVLFRAKKHVLYIQALEIENTRLKAKVNELRSRWHNDEDAEDLPYEDIPQHEPEDLDARIRRRLENNFEKSASGYEV